MTVTKGIIVILFLQYFSVHCVNQDDRIQFNRSHRLNGWTEKSRSDGQALMTIRIALKQRNLDALESIVWSVSNPRSEKYGRYLSVEELTSLVSLGEGDIQTVRRWLMSHSQVKTVLSVNRDYIHVHAPVEVIESIFTTQIFSFTHPTNSQTIHRAHSFTLPSSLVHLIDDVHFLVSFPPPATRQSVQGDFPGVDITPDIIKKQYNIDVVGQNPASSQALAEFEEAYFYFDDIQIFQKKFNVPVKNLTRLIGPNHPDKGYLGEASLDIEYIMATASEIDTWVFQYPSTSFDLVGWVEIVLSTPNAPKVHSVSWGSEESGFDPKEIARVNVEFKKMAAAGYSVLVASGDDGTGSTGDFFCGTFDPTWPATSPYVTAVGATYLDGSSGQQIAVDFSGGGFSAVNVMPDYQKQKVAGYLKAAQDSLPSSSYYNVTGRAIPDVSALGTNFQIIVQKIQGALSGTSASTPVFAGVISLLNDARLSAGQPQLGFLNPWLYTLDTVGTDITQGNNKVSNCDSGFPAWEGYDCISGIGTPDLHFLLKNLPQ